MNVFINQIQLQIITPPQIPFQTSLATQFLYSIVKKHVKILPSWDVQFIYSENISLLESLSLLVFQHVSHKWVSFPVVYIIF